MDQTLTQILNKLIELQQEIQRLQPIEIENGILREQIKRLTTPPAPAEGEPNDQKGDSL